MRMDLAIRFDYGRTVPWVTSSETKVKCELRAVAGSDMVVLQTKAPLRGEDHTTFSEFTVRKGETMSFTLTYCSSLEKMPEWNSCEEGAGGHAGYWTRWLGKALIAASMRRR